MQSLCMYRAGGIQKTSVPAAQQHPEPQTALKNTIYRKTDSNTEANKAQIFEAEQPDLC